MLSLASQTMLLLHAVSEPISHDQEVQYQLHNHLITLSGLIIASAGHTRGMTVWQVLSVPLLFLYIFKKKKKSVYTSVSTVTLNKKPFC